jgi:hypothetical protein
MGAGIKNLQKAVFDSIHHISSTVLTHRALLLPRDDPRRMSYMATSNDKFAQAFIPSLPNPAVPLTSLEFCEIMANLFGKPSPACANDIGKRIFANRRRNDRNDLVDPYGHNLKCITCVPGGHITELHNSVAATVSQSLIDAGIPHRGGGPSRRTCKDIFAHVLGPNLRPEDTDPEDQRRLQGIITDILVDGCTFLPSSSSDDNPLAGRETLVDFKTLAPGLRYTENSASDNGGPSPVAKREAAVNTDYYAHAKALDVKYNGTPDGTIGPVEAELGKYGRNGTVLGAVIGAFGECSAAIYHLRDFAVRGLATSLMERVDLAPEVATQIYKWKITNLWGLTIARGWARVLLKRRCLIHNPHTENHIRREEETLHQHHHCPSHPAQDAYAQYSHHRRTWYSGHRGGA